MTFRSTLSFFGAALACASLAAACDDGNPGSPGADSGTSDAAVSHDGSVVTDGSSVVDSGDPVDTGVVVDSGSSLDATVVSDGSVIDAVVVYPDASTGSDAGDSDGGGPIDAGPAPSCAAMDAYPVGLCEPLWGFAWNGSECFAVSGCTCGGDDCDSLYLDGDSCRAAYAGCISEGVACGGLAGDTCGENEFCDFPSDDVCGIAGSPGICAPSPEGCIDLYDPVCGCDGVTYSNSCYAESYGHVDVFAPGMCESPAL